MAYEESRRWVWRSAGIIFCGVVAARDIPIRGDPRRLFVPGWPKEAPFQLMTLGVDFRKIRNSILIFPFCLTFSFFLFLSFVLPVFAFLTVPFSAIPDFLVDRNEVHPAGSKGYDLLRCRTVVFGHELQIDLIHNVPICEPDPALLVLPQVLSAVFVSLSTRGTTLLIHSPSRSPRESHHFCEDCGPPIRFHDPSPGLNQGARNSWGLIPRFWAEKPFPSLPPEECSIPLPCRR